MNEKEKIKKLIRIASEGLSLAANAWELADAYAGGESENADEISKEIEKLERKLDRLRS